MEAHGTGILITYVTVAMYTDMRSGCIYNWLIVPSALVGFALVLYLSPESAVQVIAGSVLTIAVLFPFWQMGGIGAGDIKFLASLVPFLGIPLYTTSFLFSFLIGAIFSLVSLFRNRKFSSTIHFAVPIGISVLLSLALSKVGLQVNFYEFLCNTQ